MSNISALTNAKWFVGVPFNDTANPRLGIAEASERILGEHLLGFQVGNEPDLYGNVGLVFPFYSCPWVMFNPLSLKSTASVQRHTVLMTILTSFKLCWI